MSKLWLKCCCIVFLVSGVLASEREEPSPPPPARGPRLRLRVKMRPSRQWPRLKRNPVKLQGNFNQIVVTNDYTHNAGGRDPSKPSSQPAPATGDHLEYEQEINKGHGVTPFVVVEGRWAEMGRQLYLKKHWTEYNVYDLLYACL